MIWPLKFWKVVLEKTEENQLRQSWGGWKSITGIKKGKEHHTYTRKRRKDSIGYILRRNCLFKTSYAGKIEEKLGATGRRGRRGVQLLDDLKEKNRSFNLKK